MDEADETFSPSSNKFSGFDVPPYIDFKNDGKRAFSIHVRNLSFATVNNHHSRSFRNYVDGSMIDLFQEFDWNHGYNLIAESLPQVARILDEKFNIIKSLTYNT